MAQLHRSIDALLEAVADGGRLDRAPMAKSADSLSGSPFERVTVDGRPYVVQQATTSQLTTDAKGGGTWTFTRLAFSDGDGSIPIESR